MTSFLGAGRRTDERLRPRRRRGGLRGSRLSLGIEVLLQVLVGHGTLDAVGRHFGFGHPQDGVQHHFAELFISPVLVEMRARKAKAASALGPFVSPHHVFGLALVLLHFGIAAMRFIRARAPTRAVKRHRGEDWPYALHAF